MRPIRIARGRKIDICYLCERESNEEDEETVLNKLLERIRNDSDKDDT
jgi:hypothetical protein